MKKYDVIIVGCGPAGGQCARTLTKDGRYKVLIVEKAKDFFANNYSSAGAPIDIMHDFDLPSDVVGSYWDKIRIFSSNDDNIWQSARLQEGVVLDFAKLRIFLAECAQNHGADLLLGHSFVGYYTDETVGTIVKVKNPATGMNDEFACSLIIDASGTERSVLQNQTFQKKQALEATGIEFLIEVTDAKYRDWSHTLSLFLGQKWMPQGYSWIFPMQPNLLKVGVARYYADKQIVPQQSSYKYYMDHMIAQCIGSGYLGLKERHGKTLYYSYGRNDRHYGPNSIAIGDTISMLNPLAGEGIRHAMVSAEWAAKAVNDFLIGDKDALAAYSKRVQSFFNTKWKMCELMIPYLYQQTDDSNIDHVLTAFKSLNMSQLIDLAFHYRPAAIARFGLSYFTNKTKSVLNF